VRWILQLWNINTHVVEQMKRVLYLLGLLSTAMSTDPYNCASELKTLKTELDSLRTEVGELLVETEQTLSDKLIDTLVDLSLHHSKHYEVLHRRVEHLETGKHGDVIEKLRAVDIDELFDHILNAKVDTGEKAKGEEKK